MLYKHPDQSFASWVLIIRQKWNTHTCIHQHTHIGKKLTLGEDKAAGKRKEAKRSPEACVWGESFNDRGRECTPAKWGLDGAPREQPTLHLLHISITQPSSWPCPALCSLGLRRQDPCISLFGPAGVECLMGGRLKALDHMKLQVMCDSQWHRLSLMTLVRAEWQDLLRLQVHTSFSKATPLL